MTNLEMADEKCKMLSELEDKAIEVVLAVLNGDKDVDDRAKLAMNSINAVGKNRQTLSHRCAVEVGIARMAFAEDELKAYLQATAPEIKRLKRK